MIPNASVRRKRLSHIVPVGVFWGMVLSQIFVGSRYTDQFLDYIQSTNQQLELRHEMNEERRGKASDDIESNTQRWDATFGNNANLQPCRIYIENEPSFHFETLESVALRYPLPWESLNCSITNTVVTVDYGISSNKNRKEVKYWRMYFDGELQGSVRTRESDGVRIKFGMARPYLKYSPQEKAAYHAIIGATCNHYGNVTAWLNESPNRFCVQHKPCGTHQYSVDCTNEDHMSRTCWLSPHMINPCHFHPIDLPRFPSSGCNAIANTTDVINICTIGTRKNHESLSGAIRHARHKGKLNLSNIILSIHQRDMDIPPEYNAFHKSSFIRLVNKDDFIDFQESVSHCDLLLPLIDPDSNYITGGKHSGAMSQLMAYKIPTVLHKALHDIYGTYLTASAKTYSDTESFADSLSSMVSELLQSLPEERQKPCG
jgi:hypothetical protein